MSLLMSSVLLCGNTVKAHAQADLTPEENQKLTEFLATQPETPTNPVEETPAVPNPTPEPETPGNNGNTPVEPSNPTEGNINGDNGGETTSTEHSIRIDYSHEGYIGVYDIFEEELRKI